MRYLPEHAGFPPSLTGREILSFHARMRSVPREDRDHHVERILHTSDSRTPRTAGSAALGGMNRRLGLGTALVGEPAVSILDEPTAGLDPDGIRAFHEVVEALAAETDVTIASPRTRSGRFSGSARRRSSSPTDRWQPRGQSRSFAALPPTR